MKIGNWKLKIEEIAALTLAISPWHLHFSRGGWEVNVATTFILIGLWSFTKWLKSKRLLWLVASGLWLVLSMYFYQSARIIAPLLAIALVLCYFKSIIKHQKQVLISLLVGFILLVPIAFSLFTSPASSRFSGVGFTADVGPVNRINELRGQHPNWSSPISRLFHNRSVIYLIQFWQNYLIHFDGNFLFINGDTIQRNRVPETGLLYLTDFIFLVLGVVFLLKKTYKPQSTNYNLIIWLWLLIAPISAALTFQVPHALRSQNMVIPLTIIISCGFYYLFEKLKNKNILGFGIWSLVIVTYFWQVSRYLHEYYVHYPQTHPFAWEYGFKELVPYVESVKSKYDRVLVTDKYDQPYILFLFYSKYPPQMFQDQHQLTLRDKYNFSTVRDYSNYHFESTPWDKVRDTHSSLIVAAPEDIPDVGVNIVKTIYFPNGSPAFKIVSN